MHASATRLNFGAYVPKRATAALFPLEASLPRGHDATVAFRATERAACAAEAAKAKKGFFALPVVPYPTHDGIPPLMSKAQFDIRYHVHLQHHVDRLNALTLGSELEGHTVDVVIQRSAFDASQSGLHASACEYFNACIAFNSIRPWGTAVPPRLADLIQVQFGEGQSLEQGRLRLQRLFVNGCMSLQHGGWAWLVYNPTSGQLEVFVCEAGLTVPVSALVPLLCVDVQHKAYNVDYDADGGSDGLLHYSTNFLKAANWQLAERYLAKAQGQRSAGDLF